MVFFKFNRTGDVDVQDSKNQAIPVAAPKPMNKRQLSGVHCRSAPDAKEGD